MSQADMTPDRAHVVVGGPAHVRELPGAVVRKLAVGPMDNNAYLVTCTTTGAQTLVDPAADSDALLALVREGSGSARLDAILVTHRHRDHVGALWDMHAVTGAPVAVGDADADDVAHRCDVVVARRLRHLDTVRVGALTLEAVELRGHTPGSMTFVLAVPGVAVQLFTGDSLFPGGVGKTSSPDDFRSLLGDVRTRLFDRFPDETVVRPGHGDDTTLGRERPHLAEWEARGW
ncbi:MBL fold metallo-hydrolase [Flavimobilis soli]|nr:MBL fold metallo-hydrolase [Flavimobilis soli]